MREGGKNASVIFVLAVKMLKSSLGESIAVVLPCRGRAAQRLALIDKLIGKAQQHSVMVLQHCWGQPPEDAGSGLLVLMRSSSISHRRRRIGFRYTGS